MGCIHSKKDSGDIHPNVFRVVNIDEGGADLWSGQLEVTENDLVLYREGRDATVWPLRCLRRYGFDGEIFSFESGRRCDTGEGIYAFKCRRAGVLFRALQQNIQLRNVISDNLPFQLPSNLLSGSPSSVTNPAAQTNTVRHSSIDNGQPMQNANLNNINGVSNQAQNRLNNNPRQSPRSPSSADILEVMPLNPRPQNSTNHASNVYQTGFKSREHNNNQSEANHDLRHLYSNDFNRDLAILRSTLRQETVLNTIKDIEDETHFLQNRYLNENIPANNQNIPLSPTLSNISEPYAQLSMEQQEARHYMNIRTDLVCKDPGTHDTAPSTPLTPKLVEYCNINMSGRPEINSYANLALTDICDNVKGALHFNLPHLDHTHKFSESDTYTSMSPLEEMEVNYAVLDIDVSKENSKARELISPESQSYSSRNESVTSHCSSQPRGRLISQGSTDKGPSNITPAGIGYTTIDFDRTVALTSVATNAEMELESRKMRHNSVNLNSNSPSSNEKTRVN